MKKILLITVIGLLVLHGAGTVAITNETTGKINEIIKTTPLTIKENKYAEIQLKDTATYLMKPGQPVLPKIVKTVELEFNARSINVEATPKTVKEYKIAKEIRPAPTPVPLIPGATAKHTKNQAIYTSDEPFPSSWYTYRVGCGLNRKGEHVTHVAIHLFPVRYIPAKDKLHVAEEFEITITYEKNGKKPFPLNSEYDLVIITPSRFARETMRLVEHKNNHGVKTLLKTTEEIYTEYTGVDKPEQIKYFIKDAVETLGVKYVLLLGGMKSLIWGRSRDDVNQGTRDWHVPVRYNNLFDDPEHPLTAGSIYDPGVISDLYYADIYKEGGVFEDWDPNDDGVFAAWGRPGVENDTNLDLYPDVYLGRLACRNIQEVKIVIDKIIKYEEKPCDPSWFKKMIVVSGDGFLDQQDLDIQWNVNDLPDGEYTIYAQSINKDGVAGPLDIINVTLDRTAKTNITFNHDDHLRTDTYPFPPITEITSPSEGDILGNTDFFYKPSEWEAYCNEFTGWANVSYENGTMHIRGKSYDPRPYGNLTHVHVWIKNSDGEIVFSKWRNNTEMYYEGEWVTGAKPLKGRGGALYYMPDDFEHVILWTSNGKFTGQQDVIDTLSQGSGFVFFSGHGSPRVWADHLPGVPGNRGPASVLGLVTIDPFGGPPFFPMEKISNIDKPSVLVVGGCHNSQFNVTLIGSLLDWRLGLKLWTYGMPAPECWSWWFVRLKNRGAIATIGNTGLGYGLLGKDCTTGGLDGGLSSDFFRQYGTEGYDILGETYGQTLTTYIDTFDMEEDDHVKTITQWVLLGDPSLKIGGYP
jgi:hypothetical protein